MKSTSTCYDFHVWQKVSNRHFRTETTASDNNRPLSSKSKQTEVDLSSPTGAKCTLSPSTRQQSDIKQCYTVRKQLPTLNTFNSTLVGYLSFPVSVQTLMKRLGQLVYCWKKACNGRKALVKRQKYCRTANRVLCMSERIRGHMSCFRLT